MIKQNWIILQEEKLRILNLHENATKNLYLNEQKAGGQLVGASPEPSTKVDEAEITPLPPPNVPGWFLCSWEVLPQDGKYYIKTSEGMVEIPKLSEFEAEVVDNGTGVAFGQPVKNGLKWGEKAFNDPYNECFQEYPLAYSGAKFYFIFFDDVEYNRPVFAFMDFKGELQTGAGNMIDVKPMKHKDGKIIKWGRTRTTRFVLEISNAVTGQPYTLVPKNPEIKPELEVFELNLDSPFVFDSVELTPEAKIKYDEFVKGVKENYQGVTADVEVITSASIDGDPEEVLKSGETRKQYDLNLSKARAEAIVDKLTNEVGIPTLKFLPKGIGQTSAYGPGWTKEKPTTIDQTAPNRKLIIKLPQITREKK